MQCFFIQFRCNLGKAYDVAAQIAELEIASEVYSTSGEFDLMAKFYVENGIDIGHFVNENVHPITGIERTLTTLTFKAF